MIGTLRVAENLPPMAERRAVHAVAMDVLTIGDDVA
jgi:hypothetical protein